MTDKNSTNENDELVDENRDSMNPNELLDFNDFYELLGVEEDTELKVILQKSREMLAEYHPDVSDHPDADTLYKSINRAQNVLSDSEQKTIYNSLGHEEYIKRREKGGEMTLSESVKNSTQSLSEAVENSTSQSTQAVEQTKHMAAASEQKNIPQESKGIRKRVTESDGYSSLTSINFGTTPEESIRKLYRQMWIGRIVMILGFVIGAVIVGMMYPMELMSVWLNLDLGVTFSVQTTVLVIIIVFGVFMGSVTGAFTKRLLRPIRDEIGLEEKREKRNVEQKKKRSRGLNTSVTDVNSDSERASWDADNRYKSSRDTNDSSESVKNRTNKSLLYAPKLIVTGLIISVIASLAPGEHAWVYISSILAGEGVRSNPWLDAGGEGVESIVMLVNLTVGVGILVLLIGGVLFTMHGVSREAWYNKYFNLDDDPRVTVWDTIVTSLLAVIIGVGVLGVEELPNIPVIMGEGFLRDFIIIGQSANTLSVLMLTVILTWVVAAVFKWNR